MPVPICPSHYGEEIQPPVYAHCVKCNRPRCYYCLSNYKGRKNEFICVPCRTNSSSR